MTYPRNLVNLANLLRIRSEAGQPYHLLLTSTISVSPEVLQRITGSKSWEKFSRSMRELGKNDRKALLIQALDNSTHQAGFQCLANLIRAGYFATVVDANIDSQLESALSNDRSKNDVQILIIDRDRDEYIVAALDEYRSGPRIIKLRGSLSSNILPDNYPEFFEFRQPLRTSLERYLNQDILVVGEIYRENDISRLMASNGGNIFYVISTPPAQTNDIIKTMQARGLAKRNNLIAGEYGDFTAFFTALWDLLKPGSEHFPTRLAPPARQDKVEQLSIPYQASSKPHNPARNASEPASVHSEHQDLEASTSISKIMVQVISVLFSLVGIGVLLLLISNFLNRTRNFSSGMIIPLVIVCTVIIFGAMGIFQPDQIAKLFNSVLGLYRAGPETENKDKANQDNKPSS